MSIIYLFLYIIMFSFGISAIAGVVMFVVDIVRFGTPHKRFKTVSSVEAYYERLEELEKSIESDSEEGDKLLHPAEPIEIDL